MPYLLQGPFYLGDSSISLAVQGLNVPVVRWEKFIIIKFYPMITFGMNYKFFFSFFLYFDVLNEFDIHFCRKFIVFAITNSSFAFSLTTFLIYCFYAKLILTVLLNPLRKCRILT